MLASRIVAPAYIPLFFFALLLLASLAIALFVSFRFYRQEPRSGRAAAPVQSLSGPAESGIRGLPPAFLFVVAVLLVTFEVVLIFVFAWAILYRTWLAAHRGASAVILLLFFFAVLSVGYIWLYKKGVLDSPSSS